MEIARPQNKRKPIEASLPEDVDRFLKSVSDGYAKRNLEQVLGLLSQDFMHQGMDRTAYREHLRQSYLLEHVDRMEITLLHFQRDANRAQLSGFAETNLGVLPATSELVPLNEGSQLILESGEWKLHGNQSQSSMGLYESFQQLSAAFSPLDGSLYRALLPPCFQAPAEPMVSIKVTHNTRVRLPLKPYKLFTVQILAEYEGVQGWYMLTMPETEWLPVEGGRTLGYPKYVVDSIRFEGTDGVWAAELVADSDHDLSFTMQFEKDATRATGFERMTSGPPMIFLRKMMPSSREKPWFLLVPGEGKTLQGQVMLLKGEIQVIGLPAIRETFGRMQISVQSDQPWAGLFPVTMEAKGIFTQLSGEFGLRHSLIATLDASVLSA